MDGVAAVAGVAVVDGVDGAELVGSIDPFEPGVELDGGLELWEVELDGGSELWGVLGAVGEVLFEMATAATGIGVPLSVNTSVNLEPTGGYKGPTSELVELSIFL